MASIDVGIHPDPAWIRARHFGPNSQTGWFGVLEFAAGVGSASLYVHNRPTLNALQAALNEIRADMDKAAQTASDQTPTVECDWPAGPPGEALGVFGK